MLFERGKHDFRNGEFDGVRILIRVDNFAALGLIGGDVEISSPALLVDGDGFLFETVCPFSLRAPCRCAMQTGFRIEVEEQRKVGHHAVYRYSLDRGHQAFFDIAGNALIDARGNR